MSLEGKSQLGDKTVSLIVPACLRLGNRISLTRRAAVACRGVLTKLDLPRGSLTLVRSFLTGVVFQPVLAMTQTDLLRFIVALLDRLRVNWMLVGSHASSFYGEARSTHDIDLLVDLPQSKIQTLVANVQREELQRRSRGAET